MGRNAMQHHRNDRRRLPGALALALAVVAGGACSSARGTQNEYRGGDTTIGIEATEGNRQLAAEIVILNSREKRQADRKVVEFELQNTTGSSRRFAWSVDWFDGQGFLIDDSTRVWQPVALAGHEATTINMVAPRPDATSWKLRISSPDEIK
jgi:uncharacterized protein YcfL